MTNCPETFVDVILPLPLANFYTYLLPAAWVGEVKRGCRVIVPFGVKKFYTAIVIRIHNSRPSGYEVKSITEILDNHPILLPEGYKLWQWIWNYYLCKPGDVYKAALPSGLKLESETVVEANPDFIKTGPFTEKEERLMALLPPGKGKDLSTLIKESSLKNIATLLKGLIEKEAVHIKEEVKSYYKPKTEIRIRLAREFQNEKGIENLKTILKRARKQQEVLLAYLALTNNGQTEISKKELQEKTTTSNAIINQLTDKGVFELYEHETGRLNQHEQPEQHTVNPLNPFQEEALNQINQLFKEKNVCLLHGVTASGKTEVYIHLIEQTLKKGKQVLFLLPEIALTTQITERLKRVFGNRLGVYHSKFPDAERVEVWKKQLSTQSYDIILGVRSSIFLPFRNLGLVIVDEEHEQTYKQQDPAPRYHARNTAIVLASLYGAKTLLGTATPCIESYYNALTGKYGMVRLTKRHQEIQLPEIEIVDIGELAHKRRMNGPFSPRLLELMNKALLQHEQIILFQNRRGFAPMIECNVCGWVPKCKNCDVSLTYHKRMNQLTCHYCGYTYQIPAECPACGNTELRNKGFGTERIEENIREIFPQARTARMDLDTTRSRRAYEQIIHSFQAGETDILIGTQMVSKGLDFERVSLVGILNADSMTNFPDFRSHERAFQLMAQVAGRAGRKNKRGHVILQTRNKELPVIRQVVENDYESLYHEQLAERLLFRYPPHFRLIYVYLKHRDEARIEWMAQEMATYLKQRFGYRVLGPDKPAVGRIQTLFIRKIMLKIEVSASLAKVREELENIRATLQNNEQFRSLIIYYDVDPC
ncbi:MAG: primosomal protein N' [Bacteroidaceae bacterium]|nr:primosomal protein N' [Bacteroidaceae bacterium]